MADQFDTPREDRYFEDYRPGAVHELGAIRVEPAESLAFAERFDPQPMHIDADHAAKGPFGGLIGSGWHTAALAMRLLVDQFNSTVASLPSPGVDQVRWLKPVRPADELRVRVTILDARISKSKPRLGIVRTLTEARNQNDEPVFSMQAVSMFLRRPDPPRS